MSHFLHPLVKAFGLRRWGAEAQGLFERELFAPSRQRMNTVSGPSRRCDAFNRAPDAHAGRGCRTRIPDAYPRRVSRTRTPNARNRCQLGSNRVGINFADVSLFATLSRSFCSSAVCAEAPRCRTAFPRLRVPASPRPRVKT